MKRAVALVGLWAVTLAGCTEIARSTSPPVPPFRVAATGPGIDADRGGPAVDVLDGDARVARYRLAAASVRVYDAGAVQLGRVRAASGGFAVVLRDGTGVGSLAADGDGVRVEVGDRVCGVTCADDACVIVCDDDRVVSVPLDGDERLRDGSRAWTLTDDGAELVVTSGDDERRVRAARWSRGATGLLAASPAWGVDGVPDLLVTGVMAFAVEAAQAPEATSAAEGSGAGSPP